MLQKRQGRPLDENFVRYFWQQVHADADADADAVELGPAARG